MKKFLEKYHISGYGIFNRFSYFEKINKIIKKDGLSENHKLNKLNLIYEKAIRNRVNPKKLFLSYCNLIKEYKKYQKDKLLR